MGIEFVPQEHINKRERIRKDIEEFLQRGGTIQEIPIGASVFDATVSFNSSKLKKKTWDERQELLDIDEEDM